MQTYLVFFQWKCSKVILNRKLWKILSLVFTRLNRSVLDGRLKPILCDGVALDNNTSRFIQAAFFMAMFQGYDPIETSSTKTTADRS